MRITIWREIPASSSGDSGIVVAIHQASIKVHTSYWRKLFDIRRLGMGDWIRVMMHATKATYTPTTTHDVVFVVAMFFITAIDPPLSKMFIVQVVVFIV